MDASSLQLYTNYLFHRKHYVDSVSVIAGHYRSLTKKHGIRISSNIKEYRFSPDLTDCGITCNHKANFTTQTVLTTDNYNIGGKKQHVSH